MFGRKKAIPAQAPIEDVTIVEPIVEPVVEPVVEQPTPVIEQPVVEETKEDELTEEDVKKHLQLLYNDIAKIKYHLRIDF